MIRSWKLRGRTSICLVSQGGSLGRVAAGCWMACDQPWGVWQQVAQHSTSVGAEPKALVPCFAARPGGLSAPQAPRYLRLTACWPQPSCKSCWSSGRLTWAVCRGHPLIAWCHCRQQGQQLRQHAMAAMVLVLAATAGTLRQSRRPAAAAATPAARCPPAAAAAATWSMCFGQQRGSCSGGSCRRGRWQ